MDQLYEAIEMCFDIKNTNDECDFLNNFIFCVMSENEESDIDFMESKDKLFFKEVLCKDLKLRCSLEKVFHCAKSTGINWKVAEELDWFLFYVFFRRFGWPDLEEDSGQLKVILPDSQIRFRKSNKTEELKYKTQLVDLLDTILLWLSHQPISVMTVLMYSSAIRLASKSPVTRLHLAIRGYDWLKENLNKDINDKLSHTLQEFLVLGITDFWSRIRDAAILRLGPIVERLQLSQIFFLLDELIRLCDSNVNQWQIIDGAISAICAILKRFQKVGYKSKNMSLQIHPGISSPQFHYQIRIGETELDQMPPNIISRLQFLVFKLIYNSQQTIRDNAIKAFVLCLDRYYDNDIDISFQNVCQKLSCRPNGSSFISGLKTNNIISTNLLQSFLDPYGSQSLICLCHHLFKRLPDKINYLQNWHHYHCYFDMYLSHPASSVRLVTSNLYTYAISQAINHPRLVTNIIHNLIVKWTPDQTILLKSIKELMRIIESKKMNRISISKIDSEQDESISWEWREGRLLVFELLARLIIKNHLWYTFGTTEVDSVYSENNSDSQQNSSAHLDSSLDRSYLNLLKSSNNFSNEKGQYNNQDKVLSASLDCRRGTTGHFPVHKVKSISDNNISFSINGCDQDISRRKSLDILFRKINEESLIIKKISNSKSNMATSTKNINSILHCSFLIHLKEIEDVSKECKTADNNTNKEECKLPSFRSLLSQMLHNTAESLVDGQWDLRRMAKQALPPLGEVLRWFDPELLVKIIDTHFKFEPTLMTYVSLQLLYDSLLHTTRLKLLFAKPQSFWQPNVAFQVVNNIITNIESNLSQWMISCQHYLDRSVVFDCITCHAMNIIITCVANFDNIISEITLTKSIVEAFKRLNQAIKGDCDGPKVITSNFELYPNPSSLLSTDCPALDYAVQLIDFIKQNLLNWWQNLLTSISKKDYYEQHKESIEMCFTLIPIFTCWLHPVSKMRGDKGRYLRDIHKILSFLLKLLIEVVKIDSTSKSLSSIEFIQVLEIYSLYIQDKNIKLNNWWMRQLLDNIFLWMDAFKLSNPYILYEDENGEAKPILFPVLSVLLQRLHATTNHRRATVCDLKSSLSQIKKTENKRYSMDEYYGSPEISSSTFMQYENKTNLELFSSQAISENIQYISDESLNDSDGDKKIGSYRESHVLSKSNLSTHSHSLQMSLDVGIKKSSSTLPTKSNSSLVLEESYLNRIDLSRSNSSINSDFTNEPEAGSNWDSFSEPENDVIATAAKNYKPNNDSSSITEIIAKFLKFDPKIYEKSKLFLSDIDITILNGLNL